MKFRALILEQPAMRDFLTVAISLSKFSKECVMRLTQRRLYFIISEDDFGPRKPLVWCELPIHFYFNEYNVVGVNDEYNEIYLEFSTSLLSNSLSVLKQNCKSLKLKLTNKESPCLTLEIDLLATEMINRHCVYDIPVEVIGRKHWSSYKQPQYDDFHVTIEMPCMKSIKNIVERMKSISQSITVSANKSGRLTLQILTTAVTLSAHFPDLSVQSFAGGHVVIHHTNNDEDEENEVVCCTIDIKKFLMFLTGMQLNNCRAICSIVHEKMVKLRMEQPGAMILEIYLPEMSL